MDQSQMPGRSNGRTVLTPGFGGDDDGRYDMDVEAEPMEDHSHLAFWHPMRGQGHVTHTCTH